MFTWQFWLKACALSVSPKKLLPTPFGPRSHPMFWGICFKKTMTRQATDYETSTG